MRGRVSSPVGAERRAGLLDGVSVLVIHGRIDHHRLGTTSKHVWVDDDLPLSTRFIAEPGRAEDCTRRDGGLKDGGIVLGATLPVSATTDLLRAEGGDVGRAFADAYEAFPWRKAHMAVRAYLQNSAALKNHDYSFRRWLEAECSELGATEFPPRDFRREVSFRGGKSSIEWVLVQRLEESFYQVGPTMAPYMICDWQLWLWHEGRTGVFEAFKPDEFHIQFVAKYGREIVPADRTDFIKWWLDMYPTVPPRLVNECIWLAVENGLL